MFKIAKIKPNTFELKKMLTTDDLDPYIEIKEIYEKDLLTEICETINLTSDKIGDTHIIYENLYNVVQLCYIDYQEDYPELNMLGSYYANKKIYGSVLILNSIINKEYYCENDNITMTMLVNILNKKVIHVGIYCDPIEIKEYTYSSPLENEDFCKNNKKCMVIHFNMFNFYFSAYYNESSINKVNKYASRFIGKLVYGPVLIVSRASENEYIDLNKELFMEIIEKCGGELKRRIVENPPYKNNELQKINNGYCILDQIKYEKSCNYCKNMNDIILCSGCYRMYYCNTDCQKKDWKNHCTECSYKNTA